MNIFLYAILFFFFLSFGGKDLLYAEEAVSDAVQEQYKNSIKHFEKLNLSVLTLDNGMKVCLKPTEYEMDEIIIKVSALGGFAALDPEKRSSGRMASQIAWESGMGGMTADQMSVFLYEHCLEFFPKIHAYSRTVEGSAHRNGLEFFLKGIQMLFTKQHCTKEGYQTAIAQAKASCEKNRSDFEQIYEAAFLATNTRDFEPLKSLCLKDLENVNYEDAKDFFYRSFSDPSEFICVIVGNFKNEEILPLLKKYLESIPKPKEPFTLKRVACPDFPQGITQKLVPFSTKKDSLTRLTFPISVVLNEDNIHLFEFVCQIIEARLRRIITEKMKISHGIDVAYEFPIYPFLDKPWMTIQFRSDAKLVDRLTTIVLAELKSLQLRGVTQEEVEEIKKFEQGSDEFWFHDNAYWVSVLSNFYLWGWKPESIQRNREQMSSVNDPTVNAILKTYFSLEHYSKVTAK